jgi:hypothetical protein
MQYTATMTITGYFVAVKETELPHVSVIVLRAVVGNVYRNYTSTTHPRMNEIELRVLRSDLMFLDLNDLVTMEECRIFPDLWECIAYEGPGYFWNRDENDATVEVNLRTPSQSDT